MAHKILFIAPLPPPVHGSSMVSQYIKESKLIQESFDCDFVNLSTSRTMDEIGRGGLMKLFRFIGSLCTLLGKLITHRYDLCYIAITCHGMGFLKDAPFALLCKLFGRKLLLHQHNKGMSRDCTRWPYRWLMPLVYRNATVMLLSWHLYEDISAVVKREQVVVCPNGVPPLDDSQFTIYNSQFTISSGAASLNPQPSKSAASLTGTVGAFSKSSIVNCQLSISEAPPRLLMLSNLIVSKGIYVLLEACQRMKEQGVAFQCDYVGGESKEVTGEQFRKAIAERGLEDCVAYHGPQYGADKDRAFRRADIFVQPTFDDCFPLTLVEAMQYSLPIVSTDVGAIPDIVTDGVNGLVCRQQDVDSLVEALTTLLADATMRREMGERGHSRYLKEMTLEAFEDNFAKLLKSVVCRV